MKRILVIFLILIPILCSCSTLGKKVYYENEDIVIYEPDGINVDQFERARTNVVIKNKKNKTNILAFFYTYNNGVRDLTILFGIKSVKLNPYETKKNSIK